MCSLPRENYANKEKIVIFRTNFPANIGKIFRSMIHFSAQKWPPKIFKPLIVFTKQTLHSLRKKGTIAVTGAVQLSKGTPLYLKSPYQYQYPYLNGTY